MKPKQNLLAYQLEIGGLWGLKINRRVWWNKSGRRKAWLIKNGSCKEVNPVLEQFNMNC
jgi:hypothetical protein